jgi:hypothetical protein
MNKRIFWIILLSIFGVSCAPNKNLSQDETLAETIAFIVDQEMASTPSKVPPTLTPTYLPTETPTVEPKTDLHITPIRTPLTYSLEIDPVESYGPSDFPENINPLTGLPVENPSVLERRPISVKVSNYPRGIRPQWGLSFADHVFEYYHEAGLTRFNAIFYSNDAPQFGPIRSGRLSDKDIINMYKAFFVFGSADYRVRRVLYSAEFSIRLASASDYPCPATIDHPLCRTERDTWNHLVGSSEMIYKHFDDLEVTNERQNLDGLLFDPDLPVDGQPAASILIYFSQGSYHKWVYDPFLGRYFRFEDSVGAVRGEENFIQTSDRINDQPIAADNVIVLLADYSYYSVNPEIVKIDFSAKGQAYVYREGHAYLVNWGKFLDSGNISLSFEDGSAFPLKPGKTWFIVIGSSSEIQEENPDWLFKFTIP